MPNPRGRTTSEARLLTPIIIAGYITELPAVCYNFKVKTINTVKIGIPILFLFGVVDCGDEGRETRVDGAELLLRVECPASAQNPAFSPDGGVVLFTLFHQGYNDGPAGLYLLDISSGKATPLLDEADHDAVNLPGSCWNAVTARIAFSSDRRDRDEIWTMAGAGGDLFRVTHHNDPRLFLEPTFSPDGEWLVFEVNEDNRGSIYKVRADGSELTRLTDGPAGGTDDRQPNWSPAGDRILFQRRVPPADNWDIYTMAPDGSGLRRVTTSPAADTDASWSPDGRRIVYSSDNGELARPALYVIDADGGLPTRVTFDVAHEDGAPSWSPDGRWLAFESHETPSEDSPTALWRIPAP